MFCGVRMVPLVRIANSARIARNAMKMPLCPSPFFADDRKLLVGDGGGAGVLGLR